MILMSILLILEFLNIVPWGTTLEQMQQASGKLTQVFMPVSGMTTVIVGASFMVNKANVENK